MLVVTQDARGEGIGSALVAEAAGWARTRGLRRVWVRVNVVREATHRFYESLGFRLYKSSSGSTSSRWTRRQAAVKRIVLGDNLDVLAGLPDGLRPARLHRPALQHRQRAGAHATAHGARRGRRPHRLQGRALPHRGARQHGLARRLRRLPRLPRAAPRRGAAHPRPRRLALLPHRPRARPTTARSCSTSSSGARRFLNEIVWAYDYGGRPAQRAGRPSTTPSSGTRATRHGYVFHYDDDRPDPVHGAGPRRTGEGRARQDADRRVVAHHRQPDGQRRRPATRRRSRSRSSSASCACTRDPGDLVVDFFAGSGTTGEAAARLGAATCSWTTTRRRSGSCASGWRGTGRRLVVGDGAGTADPRT